MVSHSVLETIGNTPLVELTSFRPRPHVQVFAKLEGVNPSGSIKDRIAKKMLEEAEAHGLLTPEHTLLEASSGNTGVALALVARLKGYPVTIVTSAQTSPEKRRLLECYGATVITSPSATGSNGAIQLAHGLLMQESRYVMLDQYSNPANPAAHAETTAVEILRDLPNVTAIVAGVGSGGTLTGIGQAIKPLYPQVQIIAAEPMPGEPIAGLRSLTEGYVPPVLALHVIDQRVLVSRQQAWARTAQLRDQEGIFAGPSSGAALQAALQVAERMEQGTLVVIMADAGWKYLSEPHWTSGVSSPVRQQREQERGETVL